MKCRKLKICLVDDEELIRVTISDDLRELNFDVEYFDNAEPALGFIKQTPIDVLVTDIKMPGMSGLELMKRVKTFQPNVFIILMTAFASVKSAVDAIKTGAYDYIAKPFETEELLTILERICEIKNLHGYNTEFQRHFKNVFSLDSYWGKSPHVQQVRNSIQIVGNSFSTVLIAGETGTGKELVANILHYNSSRAHKPLIKVSCAILAKEVFESELFGHEKGAFTGADKKRIGRFEDADGGTIFLDDIDDVPLEMQVKLLRVLQEGEIERVGSSKPIKIDVRVIASTKADLKELIKKGEFREDLYYRLNVFPIQLPALRNRPEDIEILLHGFLVDYYNGKEYTIDDDVIRVLKDYSWHGNTRELKNFSERISLIAPDGIITMQHIPQEIYYQHSIPLIHNQINKSLNDIVSQVERELIIAALTECSGSKNKAAEKLGVPLTTLRSKLERYNIR
ncbi:MAG: sigma-54 dependent transcriptional regulator [Bacteroidota bacterium]